MNTEPVPSYTSKVQRYLELVSELHFHTFKHKSATEQVRFLDVMDCLWKQLDASEKAQVCAANKNRKRKPVKESNGVVP